MCILITAFPIKVAPKKVQKGTRKCPHVIPARSNRGFGIYEVQGKEGQGLQHARRWTGTQQPLRLKNEHFPFSLLVPKLSCLNTYKNVNVAPHNLSLWDSARQCPRQFHSHGPCLPRDSRRANKTFSMWNAQKPQQSQPERFIKVSRWQAHHSWKLVFKMIPRDFHLRKCIKTGIYSHMYPV